VNLPRLPAVTAYLGLSAVSSFAFYCYATVAAIYRIDLAGLGPLELVLVGTVLELSVFLFEIPTGVVADVYSRRLSIVIGLLLTGVGFAVEAARPDFAVILAAQVLWGIGYTFTSGATEAWIADEVGASDPDAVEQLFIRGARVRQIAALGGMALSVALASSALTWPLLAAGGVYFALGLGFALLAPERGFRQRSREERQTWGALVRTASEGLAHVRGRPALWAILGIALFAGLSSEPLDRLWQLHLIDGVGLPALGRLEPVVWFGIL